MLRIDQVAIDITRTFERGLDRPLCDLVERDAANIRSVGMLFQFLLGFLAYFAFFLFLVAVAKFIGQVRGDGFAFAIRVGRQVDHVRRLRQFLQLGQHLLFAGDNDVLGFEVVLDVDTETALGEILHVAVGSIHDESLA